VPPPSRRNNLQANRFFSPDDWNLAAFPILEMQAHFSDRAQGVMEMNRLVKQSLAAAATLMLASAAHANLVTYEFTGNLNIGPLGELAEWQPFSGYVSFHDGLRDRDASHTHGQFEDHDRSAVFATHIGDQNFIVHGSRSGEFDIDIFNNDPTVGEGGGSDGLGLFAANRFLSMGFFQIYDPDTFHSTRISSINPQEPGVGGFFIDEGYGKSFSGFFDTFACTSCAPAKSVPEPGTLTLSAIGVLMTGYLARRRRKVSKRLSAGG
jgi:PEP-CTERM motif-containing protein